MADEPASNIVKFWALFLLLSGSLCPTQLAAGHRHNHAGRRLHRPLDARRLAGDPFSGFISIDCGATQDSTNQRSGVPFQSDKDLISSGISRNIQPEFYSNLDLEFRSLRSFPNGTRNCYTLKPEAGGNNKYLIRALFMYGNYDGRNTTPIFDLFLGVNLWRTVLWEPQDTAITVEAITVPSADFIDVCLVNTGQGVPFISTLELRQLDNSIYTIDNGAQFLVRWHRYDVGGAKYLGYPEDVSDRNWETFNFINSKVVRTSASITQSNDPPYKLPELMLQSAGRVQNSNGSLTYNWKPNVVFSLFYFCFHFAEVERLEAGQFREMSIVLNGVHNISQYVRLEYLKQETVCSKGLPLNQNQNNEVSVSAIPGSKLPPIVNGLEIFYTTENSNSPTFLDDINAMTEIKQRYKVSRNWQGDPCSPTALSWEGLKCSSSNPSRIIALDLSSSKLTGDITSSLSSLTELESLDLSDNELTGPLPEFLALLQHLKTLNLAGNKLTGTVPQTLLQKSQDGTLVLSVDANPELCRSPPCNKKKNLTIPILCSVIAALVLLILSGVILMYTIRRKKRGNSIDLTEKGSLKLKNRQYTYSEVVSITDNFRVTIGEGGFGKVYLGTLKDQTQVAVKVLSASSQQGYKEFQAEAQLLMIVHHRNLVSLLGYCDESDHKAVIYEYMANGNLQQHLLDKNTDILSWTERLQIAVDAAHGLEYLHNGCKPPIIHRDLKPANILLDEEMQAKIADFGLSRTFAAENQSQLLTRLAGTPGYLDPENQTCGNVNKPSDIYSFGVILLQLLTGYPAITRSSEGNFHILSWVKSTIKTGDIRHIVDSNLQGEFDQNSAWKMLEIAMSCTQSNADQRPDMSQVLEELKECLAVDQSTAQSFEMSTRILAESEIAPCLR